MALKQIDQIFAAALSIRSEAQASRLIRVREDFIATVAMKAAVL